jgi:hypothetical protein
MTQLLRFSGSVARDPAIDTWMKTHNGELDVIARHWFQVMRKCGEDVREVLHDGHPTVCIADAGFAYVNAFKAHVNVGFFRGAELADPENLLEGAGRFMRHVKLRPNCAFNGKALTKLIDSAYKDMKKRVQAEVTKVKDKQPAGLKDGAQCTVVGGTHHGKYGTVKDIKTGKTGYVSITVVQPNGQRFKTLAKNVVIPK